MTAIITTIKRDKSTGRTSHTTANFVDLAAKYARRFPWEGMGAEWAHKEAARQTIERTNPTAVYVPAQLDADRMIWVPVGASLGIDGAGYRAVLALTREGKVPA